MLRSLYSAVSGMKAHQTKLDVIGNNIANVNTYGFKSSRARFQDVFYQTLQNATGGDNNSGGINASQVGYGAQLGGIDIDMGRSALQSTGRPMDVAITGEGFFQVMDPDGNIFYTRAGNLALDSASGNLVDANGYTVLGVSGDPLGKEPSSDKIHLNIPSQSNSPASKTQTINGIQYTVTSENATGDANVSVKFYLDSNLPDGADIVVNSSDISTSSITVRVNKNAVFDSLADFTSKMNSAITRGNNGTPHPAGNFTISAAPADKVFTTPLTGAELLGTNFGVVQGTHTFATSEQKKDGIFGGIKPSGMSVEPKFTAEGTVEYNATLIPASATDPAAWKITATVTAADGTTRTFVGEVNENSTSANKVWLKETPVAAGEEAGQYIEMSHPGFESISTASGDTVAGGTITAATDSKDLGLGTTFTLENGTEGGNISLAGASIAILANGIIEATHPDQGKIQIGRIDLVTFENPYGLEQVGSSYFSVTANSGEAKACKAGEDGTGALKTSSLEMSNVDISTEFSDMIVTQRGFQANSRIITVSDSILEELVNLKR
ncbi:flagellar hook-basal body complex protein [Clostridium sp. AN503]|uniref:flagellar hook protein FlgE n=1 Tax=Clostridium sp. AN503 TaxID=3160598 RepID=UPI003457B35C